VRSFASRVDRIVEVALGANLELDLAVSGAGTVIAVYADEPTNPVVPTRRFMTANTTLQYVLLARALPDQIAAAVSWTSAALAAGALTTLPVRRFSLEEVAAAQDAVEHHVVGKVLVLPS
jgi:NADPH2:quinone reductase